MSLHLQDTAEQQAQLEQLAAVLERGETLTLRCMPGTNRARLLAGVGARASAVVVQVPRQLDQVERTIMAMADALGGGVALELDAALQQAHETLDRPLRILEAALRGRPLIIDGIDQVGRVGEDRELGAAVRPRSKALSRWLHRQRGLRLSSTSGDPLPSATAAPVMLVNGAGRPQPERWARLAPDAARLERELTLCALLGEDTADVIDEHMSTAELNQQIIDQLPARMRTLLSALGLHGRIIAPEILCGVADASADVLALGEALGLWHQTAAGVLPGEGWGRWLHSWLPEQRRRTLHTQLAEAFARESQRGDDAAGRAGLSLLEAHRHYLAAGQHLQAVGLVRYGVALVANTARQISMDRDHEAAALLYEQAEQLAEAGAVPVSRQLQGYIIHYKHFNRARAGLEGLSRTTAGYARATEKWPENALFWSRRVRAVFYRGEPAQALALLAEAQQQVPDHPQKDATLIARTVRGLLRSDQILAAMLAWGDHRPRTLYARDVEARLAEALRAGWMADALLFPGVPALFFNRAVRLQGDRAGEGWLLELPELDCGERAACPRDALAALIRAIRNEVRANVSAFAHRLDAEQRMRKRMLMSAVDIVSSHLDAAAPPEVWVFGELRRDEQGRIWLEVGGAVSARFSVPPELVDALDDHPHFARVRAGPEGLPAGPVTLLEPAFRRPEAQVWAEWLRRLREPDAS